MPLTAGERLGPYEIISPVGEGGMGEVYRARDTRLDRVVALKISKADFTERFEREARAVAALNHPNICSLFDVGPNYLVMELIEGEPLKGPLPLNKVIEHASQILDALDAAHRKGITHRDLKPANILVTRQGVKLLDFGLAKQQTASVAATDATVKAALTTKGEIAGTLQYMAPEQLHGKEADARSDLFAFGCVLYEMLSGNRAFDGESAASVIASVLEREPAALDSSQPLHRVIKRCLAKDPDERFQNARDLKTALAWALDSRSNAPVTVSKRRWWIAAMAVTIVAVAATWILTRRASAIADNRVLRVQIPSTEGSDILPSAGYSLSPDGQIVAYVATHHGRALLWVRPLDGHSARPLEGTEGARNPFWSPDGKSIAYTDTLRMYRIDIAGGGPRLVCEAVSSSGFWAPDGRLIFGRIGAELLQVSADGGVPSPLTVLDRSRAETVHSSPQLLPGGRFAFYVRSDKPEFSGTYSASLANPSERRRVSAESGVFIATVRDGSHFLVWRRGNALVAQQYDLAAFRPLGEPQTLADQVVGRNAATSGSLVSIESGLLLYTPSASMFQLYFTDRTGKKLDKVGEPSDYATFRLSPDNYRVASIQRNAALGDLWVLDNVRGVSTRLTFGSSNYSYPVWSPDGSTIIFRAAREKLYRKSSNGSGAEDLIIESPFAHFPNDWSRDGKYFLYYENTPPTQRDLWIVPVSSDGRAAGKPRVYLQTKSNEYFGAFSPEPSPRWVAYQSDESGREEIYVQAFPQAKGKFQISTKGGRYARWGPRGDEIVFVSMDNKLMSASVKLNADSISASAPVELFPLPPGRAPVGHPYDIASDGKRFLVPALMTDTSQSLMLIVNWRAALVKRP